VPSVTVKSPAKLIDGPGVSSSRITPSPVPAPAAIEIVAFVGLARLTVNVSSPPASRRRRR
jgi:hypothetical protein